MYELERIVIAIKTSSNSSSLHVPEEKQMLENSKSLKFCILEQEKSG